MTANSDVPRPAFPFIMVDAMGKASLIAERCTSCGATYPDQGRPACGKCGARNSLESFSPRLQGKLHTAVIVHRGYPGTPTPFISAVVDLDDGPVIKGTLRGVPFEPGELTHGRRVRVAFDDALGRTDKDGNAYVAHYFEPFSA